MLAARLDTWDLRILEILQEDGRRSYRDIGTSLGLAPGTVRARVLQMVEDGVVEIVAVPNPHRMGMVPATIGVRVAPGQIDTAANVFAELEAVSWVALTANGYDLMIEVILGDVSAFSTFKDQVLTDVPGFISADVYLHTEYKKLRYRLADAARGEAHIDGAGKRARSGSAQRTRRSRSR